MFSVAVFLLILSSLAVYTIMRPSATRTILLTTHLQVAVLLTGVPTGTSTGTPYELQDS